MATIVTVCVVAILGIGALFIFRRSHAGLLLRDPMSSMQVYSASSVHEAHLVAGLIRQAGIDVAIKNTDAFLLAGEVPPYTVAPTLWVRGQEDFSTAREIVETYEERLNDEEIGSLPEWSCKSCGETNPGNFEVCWQCGKERRSQ
jgi:Putative prokaryotic signal transducing protein